ncbi:MAG: transporter substrate-binding domain-containing protein, partial [Oscillospiraceae bacterium]
MATRKGLRRGFALALALFLCLVLAPRSAQAAGRVVRVGFPLQAGLTEVKENGDLSGYSYDYLQELAKYTGWTYEFVRLDGTTDEVLTEMLEMLESGELDLMTGMNYSEGLAALYDYPGSNYGTFYTVLRVLAGSSELTESNLQHKQNLRIAVPTSPTRIARLEEYCAMLGITPTLMECATDAQQLAALEAGEVDALLSLDIIPMPGTHTILRFDPRPCYIATTKGNRELVSGLSAGIMQLEKTDPFFTTTLYETYFGDKNTDLIFSKEEQVFLDATPALKVGMVLGRAPFQWQDESTKKVTGVSVELVDYLSSVTGIQFEVVPFPVQQELDAALHDGTVDCAIESLHNYNDKQPQEFTPTRPFATGQIVMVLNNRTDPANLIGKRLALVEGLNYSGEFMGDVTYYPTIEDCLNAVSHGRADYAYGKSHTVQYYINHNRYSGISVVPQSGQNYRVCFALPARQSPELLSILNKAILCFPPEEMQSAIYRFSTNFAPYSFVDFLLAYPLTTIAVTLLFSLLAVSILLWFLHVRNRFTRKTALDLARYKQLAELSNEYLFEYDYQADTLTLSEKSARDIFHCEAFLEHYGAVMEHRFPPPAATLYSHLKGGQDVSTDANIHLWDSHFAWMRIIATVIRDPAEHPAYAVGKLVDIGSDVAEKAELLRRAKNDSLTGIYNSNTCRALITERMAAAPADALGTLIVLDADHFKDVNDHYGHYTGDLVLVAIAQSLREMFGTEGVYGRVGGDEFIVYRQPCNTHGQVAEIFARLQGLVANCVSSEADLHITLSMGAAFVRPEESLTDLYKRADGALYRAKENGRN